MRFHEEVSPRRKMRGETCRMLRVVVFSLGLLACGVVRAQQTTAAPTVFAVATIKPSAADGPANMTGIQIRGNRFATEGTTFLDVFKYAYDIHPSQLVGGPEWLRTEKFDILADPETEKRPSSSQMKAMVQQLLMDRFHITMHHEQKLLSVYALVKTKEEPKLTASAAETSGIPVVGYSPHGELQLGNATMTNFATFLQRFVLDRPAVDKTGIPGRFDLVLRWTPDGAQEEAAAPPGLFTAIQEQLGLKLEAMKSATDVLVIDHAEQPADN
jgi:uncharacterized protein (TIGR03435 family)